MSQVTDIVVHRRKTDLQFPMKTIIWQKFKNFENELTREKMIWIFRSIWSYHCIRYGWNNKKVLDWNWLVDVSRRTIVRLVNLIVLVLVLVLVWVKIITRTFNIIDSLLDWISYQFIIVKKKLCPQNFILVIFLIQLAVLNWKNYLKNMAKY